METIFNNLIGMMLNLSDNQLQKVKTYILTRLNIVPAQATIPVISSCPHCHGNHVIKFGKKNGKQRYFCKDCKKVFMATTNTLAEYSKYDYDKWSEYVSCMLNGLSCRRTADAIGISHKTAFYWRHKVMGSLSEVLEGRLSLSGIVEADETFFPISYKGNHSKGSFVMPRKAHHRGMKASKRGISKEQVCVSCMTDNTEYQARIAGYGRITKNQLESLNKIESGATLVTDKALAYRKYAEKFGIDLIQFKAGKEYKRGMYSLAHINAFHSTLKRFMKSFNGVSTKHLENYLNWHIYALKTVSMMFEARGNNMLDNAVHHNFTLTKTGIHQKDALPMVA